MKILLVTFSDNADHQDTLFGMYEQIRERYDTYLLAIENPKVQVERNDHTWFVQCPPRPGICRKTFDLRLLCTLILKIRKEKFDVVYFESLHVWNLPCIFFSPGKTHVYQVIHEVIPHQGDKQEKMVDLMNRAVCRAADTIVLRNETYIKEMCQRYQISPDRVTYLQLWRRYQKPPPPTYSRRVLFFGRLNPYKGAGNLLEIVRACPDIQFDVVGRVDPQMHRIAESLKNEANVSLVDDYVSDEKMRQSFTSADWVILPYDSASQSGVIIDAYKYGRPVIAFSVGAIAEEVEDGRSGYLVPAGDTRKFVQVLKQAVNMPAGQYKEMCDFAYNYGSRKYAADGAAERFCRLIEQ